MIDRYTKTVLTLIAIALVYICIVITPLPGVQAQSARRPGDPTAAGEVVVVGWRVPEPIATSISSPRPLPVNVMEPVRVAGKVVTEPGDDNARRVVLVGWEENATRSHTSQGSMKSIAPNVPKTPGLPVSVK
jgi:hypothetical protein